jgi:hypothetical protein
VPEVRILLQRPALLTPEFRAWIGSRLGSGKVALTRSRSGGSGRSAVLMRVELQADSERAMEEEIADLLTDLRLLGLHPTPLAEQPV